MSRTVAARQDDDGRERPSGDRRGTPATEDSAAYRSLPREAIWVWQAENVIGVVAVAAIVLAVFFGPFSPSGWRGWGAAVLLVAAAVALIEAAVMIPRRFATHHYALLRECIIIVRGRMWERRIVFPLSQVLYVETHQNPVLRRYGLVTVYIGTIAEPHSFGPLSEASAEEFQKRVQARAATE